MRKVIDSEEEVDRYDMVTVKRWVAELLRACKYLNSAGVIHRDVKPENICINDNWKLTLLDLGTARVIDRVNTMTHERGTHPYMAIEVQLKVEGAYDEKVDMWSVGAILCELLTGQILFGGGDGKNPYHIVMCRCGPLETDVIDRLTDSILRRNLRRDLEKKTYERIDFMEYLSDEGRKWLRDDINRNTDALTCFIDKTLQYNPDYRLSVEHALSHPFLLEVRDQSREVAVAEEMASEEDLPEDYAEAIDECKRRIWREIQAAPKYLSV
ncbi:hypothetical protein PFISCL1PPCAC_21724 [Pristionchus fissidentatus]|uniref:Protein kinase domain-containing protein n=1 Tax=Pristionchus fissidentatus TaxID=1538716 RepID=A0AAV5WEW5_9BILA|nr:hypothetical protein PFISCL1PPCAC_21724 [Pristionchus fissidentatus]